MSRRGEVQFVAIRIGRSQDPRECLGLAHDLKVEIATALGYLALWEEMVLELGDARTGRLPSGYTKVHIAAKLGWRRQPGTLIEALKRAGVLATHKKTFLHPYWRQSTTGAYAIERARLRELWREKKRRAGKTGDVPGEGSEIPREVSEKSPEKTDIDQSREAGPRPPQPPGKPGGALGASRWEELTKSGLRLRDSKRCIPLCAAVPAEHWAMILWGIAPGPDGGPSILSRKKRVARLDTHRFLSSEAYLELLPEWREKLRTDAKPKNGTHHRVAPPPDPRAELLARAADAASFVLALLKDDRASEDAKEKAKARWVGNFPDVPPPWLPPPWPGGA